MNVVLLKVVLLSLLYHIQAVVHEPKISKKDLTEPFVVEYPEEEQPENEEEYLKSAVHEEMRHRARRDIPDATPSDFGHSVRLAGDHHTYALVHWSGLPKQRIFILTRKRGGNGYSTESFLWISKDYGKTFNDSTYLFPNDAIAEWYYISSNADKLVFTDRIRKRLYVTLDEGDTFVSYNINFTPDKLLFQKRRVSNVSSYEDHILGFDKGQKELWVSTNTGQSWTKLGSNVTRYYWRELNTTYEDSSTVYFDQTSDKGTTMLYKATQSNNYLPELFDENLGSFMPESFVLSYQYMFVQKNYTILGINTNQSPLLVSLWRGMFQPANFPLDLEERHYALVDASEGQVLMAVYHNPNDTHVYISGAAGLNYSLSLNNIISPPENDWIDSYPTFDVYVVESLVGTYIANRKIPTSNRGSTVISFDKGGEWNHITPPATDRNGKPVNCNPPCSLHLRMFVDSSYNVQRILSEDSAPGIIMALGNLGQNIKYSQNSLRLYMSDNGGVTWREISAGFKQFRLVNFGVFTVVVEKRYPTNYTSVSCDEGYTWLNYSFTAPTKKIRVVALFTEYGEESQHATIFGYYYPFKPSTFEWLIVDLDFTTFNLNQCTKDDYYIWKPTDERSDQDCILGESIEYERRLPDSCCYIDANYERPLNRIPCECTAEDFECELNFERVDLNGPCTAVPGYPYPPEPPEVCPELGNYSYTAGYRKIAGDKCIPGSNTFYMPVVQSCPLEAPGDIHLVVNGELTVIVGKKIQFSFTQGQGAVFSTDYVWSFGDNTTQSYHGLASASTADHTYSKPGTYEVQIKASNEGGEGVDDVMISVSDILTAVSIVAPNLILQDVPAHILVNMTTKYGTKYLPNIFYTWKINGQKEHTDKPYFTHTFTQAGTHMLELIVAYVKEIKECNITISVKSSITGVLLTASYDGTIFQDYLPVNSPVTFSVKQLSSQEFPSDTYFLWQVLFSNGTHLYHQNNTNSSITLRLPRWDKYRLIITTQGKKVAFGVESFVAEEVISKVQASTLNPMYRVNQLVSVDLRVISKDSKKFTGTLEVRPWKNKVESGNELGTGSSGFVLDGTDNKVTTSFTVTLSGEYKIVFQVSNNISQIQETTDQTVMVADYNQYEHFRLIFSTDDIRADYHDISWQTELQAKINNTLSKEFDLSSWQLDVNVTEEDNITAIAKRSSEQLLVAHVYILPKTLSDKDVQLVYNITGVILFEANKGKITYTVRGETVHVKQGDRGPSIIIVDPIVNKKKSYLNLAIYLGIGGFVLLAIAIVIIVLSVIYYKKKYRSLEVRYSRLRQGPMRFTFTADGENLEEEDWKDVGVEPEYEDQDEMVKGQSMSQKLKPIN